MQLREGDVICAREGFPLAGLLAGPDGDAVAARVVSWTSGPDGHEVEMLVQEALAALAAGTDRGESPSDDGVSVGGSAL